MDETNKLSEEDEKLVDAIRANIESHFYVLGDLQWRKSSLSKGGGRFCEEERKGIEEEKDRLSKIEEEKRRSEDIELKPVNRPFTSEEKKRLSKQIKSSDSKDWSEWWRKQFVSKNPMFYEEVIQRFELDEERKIIIKGLLSAFSAFEVENKSVRKDYDEVFRYLNNYWIDEHSNKEEKPAVITASHQQIEVAQPTDLNSSNDEETNDNPSQDRLKRANDFFKTISNIKMKAPKKERRGNQIWKLTEGKLWFDFKKLHPNDVMTQDTFNRYLYIYRGNKK